MDKWKIEQRFLSGWNDGCWTEDDKPLYFKTKRGAERAIDELVKDAKAAVRRGDMAFPYKRSDYRAVKEKPNAQTQEK